MLDDKFRKGRSKDDIRKTGSLKPQTLFSSIGSFWRKKQDKPLEKPVEEFFELPSEMKIGVDAPQVCSTSFSEFLYACEKLLNVLYCFLIVCLVLVGVVRFFYCAQERIETRISDDGLTLEQKISVVHSSSATPIPGESVGKFIGSPIERLATGKFVYEKP